MAVNCLHASVAFTILSFGGLQWWAATQLDRLQTEGVVRDPDDVGHVIGLLLGSGVTVALLVNFVINAYVLAMLCLKSVFFVELYSSEIRRTMEHLFNYVVYKAAFLPFVLMPSAFQVCLWSAWIVLLSSLKMFQTLAKDRMERLNASPSATYGTYCRVFSSLLFVLVGDLLWIWFCIIACRTMDASLLVLLFLEPLSIAFETVQAIMIHGFQLLEMRQHQTLDSSAECLGGAPSSYKSAGGSLLEWKSKVVRNFGFILEILSLLMALGHYLMIWWLHGMAFHVIDTVLFLNSRTLVTAIIKRIRGFIKLRKALTALDVALPDATYEEIAAYDDECAICREPMSRAKKLSCNHLFHLSCLRSWLDQGLSEAYSCPTCRRPLFSFNAEDHGNRHGGIPSAHQPSGQANLGLTQPRASPNRQQNADSMWRGSALDDNWIPTWPSSRLDGAGTSTIRPVSLGRVQLMMRQLASSVSETYGQGALEDGSWNLWPPHQPSGPSAASPAVPNRNVVGMRFRGSAPAPNISDILAMADRVREILPHIPDELIIEDLQRTNNPTATVNNFLPT